MVIGAALGREQGGFNGWLSNRALAYHACLMSWAERWPFAVLFSAGALSTVAMAPLHVWPVLLLTLPVLFWSLDRDPPTGVVAWRSAAWRGWAFGFGYHFAGLYWIGFSFLVQAERFAALMPFAIASLTAALGIFFALSAIVFAMTCLLSASGLPRLILFALTLTLAEWLRGHILTGFPWNVLGYALTMPLPLMQWAGLFGIYGLTAITVLALAAPAILLVDQPRTALRNIVCVTIAPLVFALTYGMWQLHSNPTSMVANVRMRLIQPSFSQKDKFDTTKRWPIFVRHLEMSKSGLEPGTLMAPDRRPTHIVWPEAAIPFFIRRSPEALRAIADGLPDDVQIIAGTYRINVSPDVPNEQIGPYRVYNSAMVLGGDGHVASVYDKIHLVPFGEYLPAQNIMNALGFEDLTRTNGGLAIGRSPRKLMRIAGLPMAEMLICYEASFPGEINQGGERPGLLINLTNDAWFGATSGPHQHFHQTRVRAVEQGLPVVRSASTGISAIVDPVGRVVNRLGLNQIGSIDAPLPRGIEPPLYARFGRLIEAMVVLAMLIAIGLLSRHRKDNGGAADLPDQP